MSTTTPPRSRRLRLLLVLIGGGAFAIGILTALEPAVAVTIDPLVALFGNDFVLVAMFGLLAFLIVAAVLVARGVGGLNQASPPAPEDVHRVPYFGEPFDDFVMDAGLRAWVGTERHEEVRTRLREAAITTVMREANCTRAEARTQVEAGTWTDNDEAATFLAEGGTPGLAARVAASLRGDSPFQRVARATAAEIATQDPEVTG